MFIKNNVKFYTHEEVKARMLNTPAKRREYEKFYKSYSVIVKKEIEHEIGEEIRQARKKKGFSQTEFAKRLKTSRPAVSRIENGKQNLTIEYLTKISYALEKPIEIKIHD